MGRKALRRCSLAFLVAVMVFSYGCGGKITMDAYVLKDGLVAGDSIKGVKPIRNIIMWPLMNEAAGSKSKGIEIKLTDVFVDKFYLEGDFDSIIVVTPEWANEILARGGEELGLKRKPKDVNGGLIASKIGEIVGGEAIFIGTITDYDEDKIDKITESVASGTFFLIDAREKAYAALDSFTPVKYIWRATVKRSSSESLVSGRTSLDNNARVMVDSIVKKVVTDIALSQKAEKRDLVKKVNELKSKAEANLKKEEFDKAIAVWNEILKVDPSDSEAKGKIESINMAKKDAEERKKTEALKKEVQALEKDAEALEKEGKLVEAIAKWNEVLGKDKENKKASQKIEKLKSRKAEEEERAKQQEISKLLYLSQKSFDEKKYQEAIDNAKKVLALEAENEKAKAIVSDASAKIEEIKAKEVKEEKEAQPEEIKEIEKPEADKTKEEKAAAPQAAEPAKAVKERAVEPSEAAEAVEERAVESSETEDIRKRAMGYFEQEEYTKSRDEWKRLLEIAPNDSQAKEMLDTTEMLIQALQ